jgi:hypothetical protein
MQAAQPFITDTWNASHMYPKLSYCHRPHARSQTHASHVGLLHKHAYVYPSIYPSFYLTTFNAASTRVRGAVVAYIHWQQQGFCSSPHYSAPPLFSGGGHPGSHSLLHTLPAAAHSLPSARPLPCQRISHSAALCRERNMVQSKKKFRGVRQRHWGSWVSEIRHPLL